MIAPEPFIKVPEDFKAPDRPIIRVFGGGTFAHAGSHLSICAPAFGTTARLVAIKMKNKGMNAVCHLTKMANFQSEMVTNEDVARILDEYLEDENTKVIVMNVAFCDFEPTHVLARTRNGEDEHYDLKDSIVDPKYAFRVHGVDGVQISCETAPKVISKIKEKRPDILLVGFKTTCDDTLDNMLAKSKMLMQSAKCDLVVCNDVSERVNAIISNEGKTFNASSDREQILDSMIDIIQEKLSV
jgi:phosphopantothenoylcysteine synthetase/decarboxylase